MRIPHWFISPLLYSVQNSAFFCTERLVLFILYRICAFPVRNAPVLRFPGRFAPWPARFSGISLIRTEFSLFLYGPSGFVHSVQDLRFSCTKCSRFAISGQVCPLDLLVPYRKEPFLSETSGLTHSQKVRHFCLPFRSFRKVYTFQEFFVGNNHSLCIEKLLKARWLRGWRWSGWTSGNWGWR